MRRSGSSGTPSSCLAPTSPSPGCLQTTRAPSTPLSPSFFAQRQSSSLLSAMPSGERSSSSSAAMMPCSASLWSVGSSPPGSRCCADPSQLFSIATSVVSNATVGAGLGQHQNALSQESVERFFKVRCPFTKPAGSPDGYFAAPVDVTIPLHRRTHMFEAVNHSDVQADCSRSIGTTYPHNPGPRHRRIRPDLCLHVRLPMPAPVPLDPGPEDVHHTWEHILRRHWPQHPHGSLACWLDPAMHLGFADEEEHQATDHIPVCLTHSSVCIRPHPGLLPPASPALR